MKKIFLILTFVFSFGAIFAQSKPDALVLYRNGNYTEAIKVCEAEITTNPKNIDSYCVLCWSLVKNKQYAAAEMRANEARKVAPSDIRLMEALAEAKYYQGKNNEALEMFRTYIANAPMSSGDYSWAYYYMGEIYIRQAKYEHADISHSMAVHLDPQKTLFWTRCGYAREMAGSYASALVAYDKAIELKASNADAVRGKERVSARIR